MGKNSFLERLFNFGPFRVITSTDFLLAAIIFFILTLVGHHPLLSANHELTKQLADISISLAAFIIASFAIIISLTNMEFTQFLKDLKIYNNILFLIEWNIIVSIITAVVAMTSTYFIENNLFFKFTLSLFAYELFSIINLVSYLTVYGIQKSEFETISKKPTKK